MLALQDFGRDVVRGTANGTLPFSIKLELGGETEISDLHLHSVVEEQVSKLKIPVDNAVTV